MSTQIEQLPLGFAERVGFALRRLYSQRGYTQYKMSKFEEYDLYARNKDFLISDSVITFTDASGRLLALKPDVTLSIIKNSRDLSDDLQKVYYTENVYRAAKGSHAIKEIMQVGLECFGLIDDYHMAEVLTLAARSLQTISENWLLDISHLGLLSDTIDSVGLPAEDKAQALALIGEKNAHELAALCRRAGISEQHIQCLVALVTTAGDPAVVLPALQQKLEGLVDTAPLQQLRKLVAAIGDPALQGHLRIDFSVVDSIQYYNGIVFKGFIQGIPTGVLSGGQYDKLMARMGRRSGAVGFAVYLDTLEQLDDTAEPYDADVVLLYEEDADLTALNRAVEALADAGRQITACRQIAPGIRYKQMMTFRNGEVMTVEDHA